MFAQAWKPALAESCINLHLQSWLQSDYMQSIRGLCNTTCPTSLLLLVRAGAQLELEESVERTRASAPEQQQSAARGLGLSAIAELDRSPPPLSLFLGVCARFLIDGARGAHIWHILSAVASCALLPLLSGRLALTIIRQ